MRRKKNRNQLKTLCVYLNAPDKIELMNLLISLVVEKAK